MDSMLSHVSPEYRNLQIRNMRGGSSNMVADRGAAVKAEVERRWTPFHSAERRLGSGASPASPGGTAPC